MNRIPEFIAQIIPAMPDDLVYQCRAALSGVVSELSAMEYAKRDSAESLQIREFKSVIETRLNQVFKP